LHSAECRIIRIFRSAYDSRNGETISANHVKCYRHVSRPKQLRSNTVKLRNPEIMSMDFQVAGFGVIHIIYINGIYKYFVEVLGTFCMWWKRLFESSTESSF
jgi:hypothetical protein